ncbi:MAG: hypothetical protein ABI779_01500, partial [Acidobacteriota bacterium]
MPPTIVKTDLDSEIARSRKNWLDMPVIGMESEFNVWLDEVEINPEPYWKHPSAFIDRPLLTREKTSLQLPTGGAVYFDRGVIEVVTPVIELAPSSTARMVRNLWEQIGFVREQLTRWGEENGHTVRLKAYSTHYNVSYEIPKSQQNANRNVKALALLLAYILPVPVMVAGANRRSTGVGVRPRGNRIEITVDFTPDPGLMIATATLVVGIVREVMMWPSYDLSVLQRLPLPVIDGVIPGKHTTRKGWLTKDFHYEQSPYTADIDAPLWRTQFGDTRSLRRMAKDVAWYFRRSIRRFSDPFSFRLLFAILDGRAPSLLDLDERPAAYDDVGRLCLWGSVISELRYHETLTRFGVFPAPELEELATPARLHPYVLERQRERDQYRGAVAAEPFSPEGKRRPAPAERPSARPASPGPSAPRRFTRAQTLLPRRSTPYVDRRNISLLSEIGPTKAAANERRRGLERRKNSYATPFPDRRLSRSAYEQVFLKLVSGGRLRMGTDLYTPVGMKGWYHAIFRRESDGA